MSVQQHVLFHGFCHPVVQQIANIPDHIRPDSKRRRRPELPAMYMSSGVLLFLLVIRSK
jgi:hypothetical protein